MRFPHWLGYRVTWKASGQLCWVGQNRFVLFAAALFGGLILLPPCVVWFERDRLAEEPIAVLMLLMILAVAVAGAWYVVKTIPLTRTVEFSNAQIILSDVYLIGRRVQEIRYSALKTIHFSASWPSRSLFKLAHVALIKKDRQVVQLVHRDSPMYSWQGRAAYQSLVAFLAERELAHLIDAAGDFPCR